MRISSYQVIENNSCTYDEALKLCNINERCQVTTFVYLLYIFFEMNPMQMKDNISVNYTAVSLFRCQLIMIIHFCHKCYDLQCTLLLVIAAKAVKISCTYLFGKLYKHCLSFYNNIRLGMVLTK